MTPFVGTWLISSIQRTLGRRTLNLIFRLSRPNKVLGGTVRMLTSATLLIREVFAGGGTIVRLITTKVFWPKQSVLPRQNAMVVWPR